MTDEPWRGCPACIYTGRCQSPHQCLSQLRPKLEAELCAGDLGINWQARAEAAEAHVARLRAERNLAYGFLWCMPPDDRNPGLGLARRARETLLAGMDKEEQRAGIEAARTALKGPSR